MQRPQPLPLSRAAVLGAPRPAAVDENSQCCRAVWPLSEVHRCKITQEELWREITAKNHGCGRAEIRHKSNSRDDNCAIQVSREFDEGHKPSNAKN
jgi:hypothetical protein